MGQPTGYGQAYSYRYAVEWAFVQIKLKSNTKANNVKQKHVTKAGNELCLIYKNRQAEQVVVRADNSISLPIFRRKI